MDTQDVSVMLLNLGNVSSYGDLDYRTVWNGPGFLLSERDIIKSLVDKLTDNDWFDEDEMWECTGETLFGVSTKQTKEQFCAEVEKKYQGNEEDLVNAINESQTYEMLKLVAGFDNEIGSGM